MVFELIGGVWQFDLRGVNAYLVEDDVLTLVDVGTPFDKETLRAEISKTGHAIGDIERVLLTHYDFDHVGALAALEPQLTAPVYVGEFDGKLLTGETSPPVTNHKGVLQRVLGFFLNTPSLAVKTVEDGERIGSFTVYHTPGHSPGHVSYVSDQLGVGLLGDLVTESGGELSPSSWLMSYDSAQVKDSIRSLASRAPAFNVACMGHGRPLSSGGSEALQRVASR